MQYEIKISLHIPGTELSFHDLQFLEQQCKDAIKNYLKDEEGNFEILVDSRELD